MGSDAMDEDLEQLSAGQLIDEIRRLRNGIREHRDSTGQELCWHHPKLWGLLPEKTDPQPVVPEWPQFLSGCIRYRQSLDEQLPGAPRTSEEPRAARIDHINIAGPMETLEACRRFYVEVLGLTVGARPPFRRRGFWLYSGNAAIVHLTESASAGHLNHVAFSCEDADGLRAKLEAHRIPFTVDEVPATGQVQFFLRDPAGAALELNFAKK